MEREIIDLLVGIFICSLVTVVFLSAIVIVIGVRAIEEQKSKKKMLDKADTNNLKGEESDSSKKANGVESKKQVTN